MQIKKPKLKNQALVTPLLIVIMFSGVSLFFHNVTLYLIDALLFACVPFATYYQYKKHYNSDGEL